MSKVQAGPFCSLLEVFLDFVKQLKISKLLLFNIKNLLTFIS